MIEPIVIQGLIEIGRLAELTPEITARLLNSLRPHDAVYRTSGWDKLLPGLSTADTVALIRGMGVAESRLRWLGGSVAPIIGAFNDLERRNSDLARQTARWVAEQWLSVGYDNHYVNHVMSAMHEIHREKEAEAAKVLSQKNADTEKQLAISLGCLNWEQHKYAWLINALETRRQLQEIVGLRQALKEKQHLLEVERARHRASETGQEIEELRRENHRLAGLLKNERRRAVLAIGETAKASERLKLVAQETDMDIQCFPQAWADIDEDVVRCLGSEVRSLLIERLRDRQTGPWKSLCGRLQKFVR